MAENEHDVKSSTQVQEYCNEVRDWLAQYHACYFTMSALPQQVISSQLQEMRNATAGMLGLIYLKINNWFGMVGNGMVWYLPTYRT